MEGGNNFVEPLEVSQIDKPLSFTMSRHPKPAPIFCIKWPWDTQTRTPCNFDTPWIFKSIQTLGSMVGKVVKGGTLDLGFEPLKQHIAPLAPIRSNNSNVKKGSLEQGEAEQRALANALVSGKEATVIEFYSSKCSLCNSLLGFVLDVENRYSDWLNIVMADAENDNWLPELLHYDIKYVPCFVILDKHGRALGKTGVPNCRLHVVAGVSHLLKLKRPRKS